MDNVLILAFAMLHVSLSTPESFLDFYSPGPWKFPKPKLTFVLSSRYSQGPVSLGHTLCSSVLPGLSLVVAHYLIDSLLLLHKLKTYVFLNPEIFIVFSERVGLNHLDCHY